MADLTATTFVARFPEFASAYASHPAMVQGCLDAATAQVDEAAWKLSYTDGVFYLAAHLLAMSPFGENLRLVSDKTSSPYKVNYDLLLKTRYKHFAVGGGFFGNY